MVTFVGIGAVSVIAAYAGLSYDGVEGLSFLGFSLLLALMAIGLPIWERRRSRRLGEMVIDPVRGEIRVGRSYEIPFSQVRQVEVVEQEYTYTAMGPELSTSSSDITGWAIEIGGGVRLCGENGLSRKRVAEIADALRVRVEVYRTRTGQRADPLPRPTTEFLERLAASLRHEGETFKEDWLALDGPMVELMREFNREPDERTMGRVGEFAQALRKAGFDLGDPPAVATPLVEE